MTDLNDDIARYLSGRMSAAEMHALEKKALDDPFLADAIAGGESISAEAFGADVRSIQDMLNRRTVEKSTAGLPEEEHRLNPDHTTGGAAHEGARPGGRQVSFWSWPTRIAAGLLLAVSASVVIFFISDKRTDHLAMAPESVEQEATSPKGAVTDSILSNQQEQPEEASANKLADSQVSAQRDALSSDKDSRAPVTANQLEKEELADASVQDGSQQPAAKEITDEETSRALAGNTPGVKSFSAKQKIEPEREPGIASDAEGPPAQRAEQRTAEALKRVEAEESALSESAEAKRDVAANDDSRRAAKKEAAPSAAAAPINNARTFTGKVVDSDGTAIPGVNVVIKGTNTGTVTDVNGDYQLVDNGSSPTLVYTFIGYSNVEEVAEVSKPTTVTLQEDLTQLSEVVVAGYGTARTDDLTESTYEFAYPVGGRRAYKQYLEKNLQYPQDALLNNVEGRVTVTFAVETTGLLSDFKVVKGIGNGCDEEVIRLIKSGPKWNPTKRDETAHKSVIKVRMRFQLPKEKKDK